MTDYTEVLRKYKKIIVEHPDQTEFQYQVGTISALFGIATELSRIADLLKTTIKNDALQIDDGR